MLSVLLPLPCQIIFCLSLSISWDGEFTPSQDSCLTLSQKVLPHLVSISASPWLSAVGPSPFMDCTISLCPTWKTLSGTQRQRAVVNQRREDPGPQPSGNPGWVPQLHCTHCTNKKAGPFLILMREARCLAHSHTEIVAWQGRGLWPRKSLDSL